MPEGFLGPIKNKPEYINGRIICPSSREGKGGWRIHFEYSDDKGKTWKTTKSIPAELSVPTQNRKKGGINVDDQEAGEAIQGEGAQPILAIQPSILKHKEDYRYFAVHAMHYWQRLGAATMVKHGVK